MGDGFGFPQSQLRQILGGNMGDKRDLRTLSGFLAGEIFFQRLLFQTSHAAKKIDLVGCANLHSICRDDTASPETGYRARKLLTYEAGAAFNVGKELGAL